MSDEKAPKEPWRPRRSFANTDPRAVTLVNLLHELRRPHLTILFGSRARGDYAEGHSDVDIVLVEDQRPDEETLNHSALAFRKAKAELYRGQCIDSQWVIRTPEEFKRRSRSVNAVDAKALRDGYILGDEREHYSTLARVRSTHHQTRWANSHLSFLNNLKGTDQEQQSTQAYLAITNALTAAGNAAGEWCPDLHDVEMLLELARKADPKVTTSPALNPRSTPSTAKTGRTYPLRCHLPLCQNTMTKQHKTSRRC